MRRVRSIVITVSIVFSVLIMLTLYLVAVGATISPMFCKHFIRLNRSFQYSNHPNAYPGTSWVSDIPLTKTEVSLQVFDNENGVLVYKDSYAETTYYVEFVPGAVMLVYENNLQVNGAGKNGLVADYVMISYSSTVCKITGGDNEVGLPEEFYLRRLNIELDE